MNQPPAIDGGVRHPKANPIPNARLAGRPLLLMFDVDGTLAPIMSHPSLQGLRRFSLSTRDAHGLYAQFGFEVVGNPDRQMEIMRRDIYLRSPER